MGSRKQSQTAHLNWHAARYSIRVQKGWPGFRGIQNVQDRMLQPGQKVRFKLRDIHLPSVQDVLHRMTPETELQGCISLLSDEGSSKAAYAVVEVKGILMPVIVPAARVKPAMPRDEAMVA